MNPADLYRQYLEQEASYEFAARAYASLLERSLTAAGVEGFSITARHKVPLELFKKQRIKHYQDPWIDCPDLVGARVIVADRTRMSEVQAILENASEVGVFEVEDQAAEADPATISYRGLHLHARSADIVNANGIAIRCEVQVRTIAQHAWAETQHRLVYKKPIEVPRDIARLFNRLLVLIELFDLELEKGVVAMQDLESYKALELSRHLETILSAYTHIPSSLELTIETVSELSRTGLGSVDEIRDLTDGYVARNESSVEQLVREYGPASNGFDVAEDWILSQGECLVFLALLDARPDAFSNALHGSDLYPVVESLALKTGNTAFLRS